MDEMKNPEEDGVTNCYANQTKEFTLTTIDKGLQFLDKLYKNDAITHTRFSLLKSKYLTLLDAFNVATEVEKKYINKGIELLEVVEKQSAEIQKSEKFPSDDDNEMNKLRSSYLKYSNELAACAESMFYTEYQLESLLEEKKVLEQEVGRMPKQEEVDRCLMKYQEEVESLRQEVYQKTNDCKHLNEECANKVKRIVILKKEIENIGNDELNLKEELISIHNEPAHISKQSELIKIKLRKTAEKAKLYDIAIEEINIGMTEMNDRIAAFNKEKEDLVIILEELHQASQKKEKEADLLVKECEFGKDHQAELLGDRATLDLKMKHAIMECKAELGLNARKVREKDRELKHLKKVELQYSAVEDNFAQTKLLLNEIKLKNCFENKDCLLEKRTSLQKEVENMKKAFADQNSLTLHEKQKFEIINLEENCHMMELSQLRCDIADLTRLAQIKADERECKARDYLKAEVRCHKITEELKIKELSVQDNAKKYSDVQRRLEDFSKLYNIIKNERNKFVNLLQTSTQCTAELHEKARVLQNEVEMLRNSAAEKERQFQKSKQVLISVAMIRDSVRNDICKQQVKTNKLKEKSEQHRISILALNNMIKMAEDDLLELKNRYECSVQEQNNRGMQVIQRNEEVCALCEKNNKQDVFIRNVEIMFQACEEEFNFLKTELEDFKRSISLLKSIIPKKKALNDELSVLQLHFAQCQRNIFDLEKRLENPLSSGHLRLLPGHEPSSKDLLEKIEQLELKLSDTEERLTEKKLIYEQLKKLVQKEKDSIGKEETINLARKVNEVQAKIKETTRKMMAIVSELSMNQALSMKYQQEVNEKESLLQQSYTRLEQGKAPYDDAEQEWLRYLRDEQKQFKMQDSKKKANEDLEQYMISGGVITTAEPRPNAYIPDDDSSLPLPRPYGSNAPFKPTELGSNMRHIRKPSLKPIEI